MVSSRRCCSASPITLIALLTTVAHSWRHEALTENYREVARLGKEFYERLATFADRFDDLRKRLDGAVQAYNEAAGSLESAFSSAPVVCGNWTSRPPPSFLWPIPSSAFLECSNSVGLMGLPEGATTDDDLTDSQ